MDVLEDYTGHTDPGGAAIRRDLDALSISKLSVGPMDNNAYLLVCRASNEALLIDAANEPERLADLVGAGDSRPELRHVVTTHRHYDHWQALGAVAGMFETRQIAHPLDAPELPIPADELVEQGDTVRFGEIELGVVHLRGHTPGSIALVYRDGAGTHIFTGDSLFPGGPGRTTSPGGLHVAAWTTWRSGCSARCPTRRGCTPATATTPRSARSARHSPEWRERAAGELTDRHNGGRLPN